VIPRFVVDEVQRQAVASYPDECCGLLLAKDEREVVRAVPMENIQNRLHALDPETHPRTGRNGFHMDALRVWREVDAAAARGERLLAFYHSHIDCGAYFSQEDRDMAAPPPDRVPTYPGIWHVVVACWADGPREARAFRWDGRDFVGHALTGFLPAPLPGTP
jgi:proteasome lid subunit RPN8/RPN11